VVWCGGVWCGVVRAIISTLVVRTCGPLSTTRGRLRSGEPIVVASGPDYNDLIANRYKMFEQVLLGLVATPFDAEVHGHAHRTERERDNHRQPPGHSYMRVVRGLKRTQMRARLVLLATAVAAESTAGEEFHNVQAVVTLSVLALMLVVLIVHTALRR